MFRKQLKFVRQFAVLASVLAAPATAVAGTPIVYTDGDRALFQIEAPDFWTVRTGGLRDLTPSGVEEYRDVSRIFGLTPTAHDGIWVGFMSPTGVSTLDAARDYLKEIGLFLVKDVVVNDTKDLRIGGLPAQTFSGTGHREGKSLEFTAITIDLPNGRVAVSIVVFEAGTKYDIVGDINTMMSSFKAMN